MMAIRVYDFAAAEVARIPWDSETEDPEVSAVWLRQQIWEAMKKSSESHKDGSNCKEATPESNDETAHSKYQMDNGSDPTQSLQVGVPPLGALALLNFETDEELLGPGKNPKDSTFADSAELLRDRVRVVVRSITDRTLADFLKTIKAPRMSGELRKYEKSMKKQEELEASGKGFTEDDLDVLIYQLQHSKTSAEVDFKWKDEDGDSDSEKSDSNNSDDGVAVHRGSGPRLESYDEDEETDHSHWTPLERLLLGCFGNDGFSEWWESLRFEYAQTVRGIDMKNLVEESRYIARQRARCRFAAITFLDYWLGSLGTETVVVCLDWLLSRLYDLHFTVHVNDAETDWIQEQSGIERIMRRLLQHPKLASPPSGTPKPSVENAKTSIKYRAQDLIDDFESMYASGEGSGSRLMWHAISPRGKKLWEWCTKFDNGDNTSQTAASTTTSKESAKNTTKNSTTASSKNSTKNSTTTASKNSTKSAGVLQKRLPFGAALQALDADNTEPMHTVGEFVVLQGLVSKPELNGQVGCLLSYNEEKERFGVELLGSRGESKVDGSKTAKSNNTATTTESDSKGTTSTSADASNNVNTNVNTIGDLLSVKAVNMRTIEQLSDDKCLSDLRKSQILELFGPDHPAYRNTALFALVKRQPFPSQSLVVEILTKYRTLHWEQRLMWSGTPMDNHTGEAAERARLDARLYAHPQTKAIYEAIGKYATINEVLECWLESGRSMRCLETMRISYDVIRLLTDPGSVPWKIYRAIDEKQQGAFGVFGAEKESHTCSNEKKWNAFWTKFETEEEEQDGHGYSGGVYLNISDMKYMVNRKWDKEQVHGWMD